MSQEEITSFLKRNKTKWFRSNDLSRALKISKPSINRCLSRMRKYSEVKEKNVKVMLRSKFGFIKKEVPFYAFKRL